MPPQTSDADIGYEPLNVQDLRTARIDALAVIANRGPCGVMTPLAKQRETR